MLYFNPNSKFMLAARQDKKFKHISANVYLKIFFNETTEI